MWDLHRCSLLPLLLVGSATLLVAVMGWPDGAPCLHAVMDSMNPLEAVEHQGGLQLTPAPYYIDVDVKCYKRGEPVQLILSGNGTQAFKGFAIQPYVYRGNRRIGQFYRLDDNGSWQWQCFKGKHDSATHSHDEPKGHMKLWWQNDEGNEETVQFVATVVASLRQFWVKSVFSPPIPPCSQGAIGSWSKDAPTVPPPVSSFKLSTFQLFNQETSNTLESSISIVPLPDKPQPRIRLKNRRPDSGNSFGDRSQVEISLPRQPPPPFSQPQPQSRPDPTNSLPNRRRLNHVIPMSGLVMNRRPAPSSQIQQPAPSQNPDTNQRQGQSLFRTAFIQQQPFNGGACRDLGGQCSQWLGFCPTNAYMRSNCQRSCRMC